MRPVQVRVDVELASLGRWQAEVVTSGSASGTRRLDGGSCSAIALAAAVGIALAIDPGVARAPPEREAEPVARAVVTPVKVPVRKRIVPFVRAFAGLAVRSLPGASAELSIGAGLQRGLWGAELTLSYAPPQAAEVKGASRAGAEIDRWCATGSGCIAAIDTSATALDACIGVAAERVAARATGVSNPGHDSVVLFSPVATLKSRTRLGSQLSLVLAVTTVVRPFHPRFVIGGVGPVYAIPAVGGALSGGLQLAF